MFRIDRAGIATCLALRMNDRLAHSQRGLRILAIRTEHEFLDEPVEDVLQLAGIVFAIHDIALVLQIELRLRAELTTEVFRRICNQSLPTST